MALFQFLRLARCIPELLIHLCRPVLLCVLLLVEGFDRRFLSGGFLLVFFELVSHPFDGDGCLVECRVSAAVTLLRLFKPFFQVGQDALDPAFLVLPSFLFPCFFTRDRSIVLTRWRLEPGRPFSESFLHRPDLRLVLYDLPLYGDQAICLCSLFLPHGLPALFERLLGEEQLAQLRRLYLQLVLDLGKLRFDLHLFPEFPDRQYAFVQSPADKAP